MNKENLVAICKKQLQKFLDDSKYRDRVYLRKKYFLEKCLKKALVEAKKERKIKDAEKRTQQRVGGPANYENALNSKSITEDELIKEALEGILPTQSDHQIINFDDPEIIFPKQVEGELQQHRMAGRENYEYVPNCEWILQSENRSLLSSTSLNSSNLGDLEGLIPAEIPEEDFNGPQEHSSLYANIQKNESSLNQYIQEFCRHLEQIGEIPEEDFKGPEESRMYGDPQNNNTDIHQYIDELCNALEQTGDLQELTYIIL
ncbi:hypothetical protein HNY73_015193 [Argiope bruennichi]|uniref:Uncharacterized protein n=1 Tax=Argiope bruennichi TaxID=94029 RepID=A0A8T0ERB7_ARGBR|nr:hypothetical protein HNY73_015193 [Argiope bruennichi]